MILKTQFRNAGLRPLDDEIGFYILLSGSLRTTQKMIMSREIYTYTLGGIAMEAIDTKLNFIDCPAIGKTPGQEKKACEKSQLKFIETYKRMV